MYTPSQDEHHGDTMSPKSSQLLPQKLTVSPRPVQIVLALCPTLIADHRIDNPRSPHRHHHHHHHHDDYDDDNDDNDDDDDDYNNDHDHDSEYDYAWSTLTSETWSDTEPSSEPSSEPQTDWPSILASTKSDRPTTPTDSESSPSTLTRISNSKSGPVMGATSPTSRSRRPYTSRTRWASTMEPSTIYSTPTSSPTSELASETDVTSASSADEASSSDTTYSRLSSTNIYPSSSRSQPQASRESTSLSTTESTTRGTTSSSSSTRDIIRPSSTSYNVVAIITIYPDGSSGGANPSDPSPTRLGSSNPGTSSGNVSLGVIIGTVFGIIFGGLALFCVLFGIKKLRQRKRDNESEQRARRQRMGMGMASTSTVMLVRGQEPGGNSAAWSLHTNEHGEYDRTGILVRDGQEVNAGSGSIRFANQRRPSSVPVPPEGNDPSSAPLMQEYSSPSNAHPPRYLGMERSHSPTVPSPLRTNPVTGRDSPSGWI